MKSLSFYKEGTFNFSTMLMVVINRINTNMCISSDESAGRVAV